MAQALREIENFYKTEKNDFKILIPKSMLSTRY